MIFVSCDNRRTSPAVALGMCSDIHDDGKRRRIESCGASVAEFECGGAEALDRAMKEEMQKSFGYSTFKDGKI